MRLAFYTVIVSCETEKAVFSAFLGWFLLKNPLFYLENEGFLLLRLSTPDTQPKGKKFREAARENESKPSVSATPV